MFKYRFLVHLGTELRFMFCVNHHTPYTEKGGFYLEHSLHSGSIFFPDHSVFGNLYKSAVNSVRDGISLPHPKQVNM